MVQGTRKVSRKYLKSLFFLISTDERDRAHRYHRGITQAFRFVTSVVKFDLHEYDVQFFLAFKIS
jgi:hypothetical protein